MSADLSLHMKNNPACKDKWGSIYGEFNNFFDHIGQNEDCWAMST
jgi:hypothetical protein